MDGAGGSVESTGEETKGPYGWGKQRGRGGGADTHLVELLEVAGQDPAVVLALQRRHAHAQDALVLGWQGLRGRGGREGHRREKRMGARLVLWGAGTAGGRRRSGRVCERDGCATAASLDALTLGGQGPAAGAQQAARVAVLPPAGVARHQAAPCSVPRPAGPPHLFDVLDDAAQQVGAQRGVQPRHVLWVAHVVVVLKLLAAAIDGWVGCVRRGGRGGRAAESSRGMHERAGRRAAPGRARTRGAAGAAGQPHQSGNFSGCRKCSSAHSSCRREAAYGVLAWRGRAARAKQRLEQPQPQLQHEHEQEQGQEQPQAPAAHSP